MDNIKKDFEYMYKDNKKYIKKRNDGSYKNRYVNAAWIGYQLGRQHKD